MFAKEEKGFSSGKSLVLNIMKVVPNERRYQGQYYLTAVKDQKNTDSLLPCKSHGTISKYVIKINTCNG